MLVTRRRIELKRIANLIRQGLLREAARSLREPQIRAHRDGCRLALRLVEALCDRAEGHLQAGELTEAIDDLQLAAQFASGDKRVVALKRRAEQQAYEQARRWLAEGAPQRAVELIDALSLRRVGSSDLDMLRHAARHWVEGRRHCVHHRFGAAVAAFRRARRLLPDVPRLQSEFEEAQELQARCGQLEEELTRAYQEREWFRVRQVAEQLLALCPGHELAVAARDRVWRELGGSLYAAVRCKRGSLAAVQRSGESGTHPRRGGKAHLWQVLIDGGGHYLLTTAPEIVIGNEHGDADVRLLAPVGSRHIRIERDREGYVLVPQRPAWVNGRQVVSPLALRDGATIELARGVGFTFRLPSYLSRTALLVPTVRSVFRHRLDAVVLVARVCLLGEGRHCHLFVPDRRQLTLVVEDPSDQRFLLRTEGELLVNGTACGGEARFVPPARIELPSTRIVFAHA